MAGSVVELTEVVIISYAAFPLEVKMRTMEGWHCQSVAVVEYALGPEKKEWEEVGVYGAISIPQPTPMVAETLVAVFRKFEGGPGKKPVTVKIEKREQG